MAGRKLGRTSSHLKATLANMAVALLRHEQISTTLPKAKELRPFVEKLITLGKTGGLHNRRRALSVLRDATLTQKLFGPLAERYKDRKDVPRLFLHGIRAEKGDRILAEKRAA